MEIIGINGSQKLLGRTHEEIMEYLSKDFPKTEDSYSWLRMGRRDAI